MGFFDFDEGFDNGYAGVIDRVEFGPNQFGQLQATVTVLRDEPFTGKDGQLVTTGTIWVTVGASSEWEACDDGAGFRHTSDAGKKIRANSQYATFLDRVVELIGEDEAKVRFADGYKSAKSLEGLHLEWNVEGAGRDYSFTDKETGEKKEGKTRGRWMPVNLLAAAHSNGAVKSLDVASLQIPEDLLGELTVLARELDKGPFTAKAIDFLPRLAQAGWGRDLQDPFIGAVGDGSLHAALKG